MHEEKERLIADLDSVRAHLNDVVKQMSKDTQIYPDWKLKQFLDHVAGWDDAVLAAIQSHSIGDVPAVTAPYGIDYYNAQTVTTRESLSFEHSQREYQATRELLKQAIRLMPDDRFAEPFVSPWGEVGTVAQVVEVFVDHERTHAQEIEKVLEDNRVRG
ncbi:MAG: DinB family protein [Chloroflexota bacterium]|nr:MAG: DinB family protein [Chloroflexota bacterium]